MSVPRHTRVMLRRDGADSLLVLVHEDPTLGVPALGIAIGLREGMTLDHLRAHLDNAESEFKKKLRSVLA